ncbi:MAG: hypothetical protein M1827_005104 [Pycnora praestabilis]|nr:MAG: hypothetical protein M1827_005104 [Pycnora praestabilis]
MHTATTLLLAFLPAFTISVSISLTVRAATRPRHAVIQTCNNIAAGICCNFPDGGNPPNQIDLVYTHQIYRYVLFNDLFDHNLAFAWGPDDRGDRDIIDPPGQLPYVNRRHRQWTSGCYGQVVDVDIGPGTKELPRSTTNARGTLIHPWTVGANYIDLPDGEGGIAAADGLRAFLGGGGELFRSGRSNRNFPPNSPRSNLPSALTGSDVLEEWQGYFNAEDGPGYFQWADMVEVDGVVYKQREGDNSLIYASEDGKTIDYTSSNQYILIGVTREDCDNAGGIYSKGSVQKPIVILGNLEPNLSGIEGVNESERTRNGESVDLDSAVNVLKRRSS